MEKPIDLLIEEMETKIIKAIEESRLPWKVIELEIFKLTQIIEKKCKDAVNQERRAYLDALKEESKKDGNQ
jgi:hypothetical protein